MSNTSRSHTVFHHRYHIVWITKYRYKVLEGALRERIRTIIRQECKELGVQIVSGVLQDQGDAGAARRMVPDRQPSADHSRER